MKRHDVTYSLLFAFAPLAMVSMTIAVKMLGGPFWWLGLALGTALFAYVQEGVLRGFRLLRRMPRERLDLNLRAAGHEGIPATFPFQIRFFLLAFAIAATFLMVLRNEVSRGLQEIGTILTPEELVLRIEYPTWTDAPPTEKKLSEKAIELPADSASYFEVRTRNLKLSSWNLTVAVTQSDQATVETTLHKINVTIGREGSARWGQSIARLYETFSLDGSRPARIFLRTRDQDGALYDATIKVSPLGVPQVSLAQAPAGTGDESLLHFLISAESRIPLSQIELMARTRSGYRFSKTAAEYAGSSELSVKGLRSELSTLGVPFAAKDSLFVRAVAKTIVAGLAGQSDEIEIPIRSREEVRQELMERLEAALKEFQAEKEPWPTSRERISEKLAEAMPLADALGRQSLTRRRVDESRQLTERAESRRDPSALQAQQKLRAALEALRRTQTVQETASLFARLRNLQNSIRRADENNLPELSNDVEKLAQDTESLKGKLGEMIADPNSGLTAEEKRGAQSLLSKDTTAQKTLAAEPPLKQKEREQAAGQIEEAIGEAQKNLAGTIQMLAAARQRTIRQAKEQLAQADQKLQNARTQSPQQAHPELKSADETLSKLPRLGKEFNEAAAEAQEGGRSASEGAKAGQTQKMLEGIERGQEGIVKAIEALQDEEQQEREQQQESDGKEHRSNQELLSAQGVLDANWRKRILDEISRLRAAGESADSPVLKYLESRLR